MGEKTIVPKGKERKQCHCAVWNIILSLLVEGTLFSCGKRELFILMEKKGLLIFHSLLKVSVLTDSQIQMLGQRSREEAII